MTFLTAQTAPQAAPLVWRSARAYDSAAWATLALLTGIALLTFRDYGLGWDDYTHSQYGDLLLSLYQSGFTDDRALSFVNLYMYGGGFDMLAALVAKVLPFDLFETRRLVGALVGIVGIAATWRIARRLAGPAAGLAALVLLASAPLFYGHIFMNPKDAPFAVAMIVFLLTVVRAIEEFPSPSRTTVLYLGAALGLVVGTRILGLIAGLFVAPALLVLFVHDYKIDGLRSAARRMAEFLIHFLPAAVLAYVVMGLLWPWSVLEPLNPLRAVEYFAHFFEKPWKEMYEGALISVPDMPSSYVPRLLALKLPETTLILSVGGIIGGILVTFRHSLPVRWRASLLLMVCAAVIPVIYAMISRPALYNGLRHFTFIVPPLAVVGGVATVWMGEWLRARGRAAMLAGLAVFGLGVSVSVADMVRLHPYQYTHFNWLAGGVRGADLKYMLDYWGLAFKQATEELNAKIEEKKESPPQNRAYWIVAVCGPQRVAQVELGPKFHTTADPRGADFALMLGEFYCREIKSAPAIVEVARDGVVFASVYDIRGRTVSELLTMPPP